MSAEARILYLEDDADLGTLTAAMLRSDGFDVQWERNGTTGLARFKQHTFDLCVLDITMPGLDGYTLAERIRALAPDLPIIFLSAHVLAEDVVKGFTVGGDDYMRKPFSVEELMARMSHLLKSRQPPQVQRTTWPIGSYTYDHGTYELRSAGGTVRLSPRAGELLLRLATHPERFLQRRETLLELWGDDSFFNGRSLDVFITKLRKQLAGDPHIRILNIRGQGYKLIVDERRQT
ncbi:MAG: response regulator transcription factor [Flavobacteriales bacterium]|nr:response regulator transcription factor [Flavobacteriales bacterium]